MLLLHARRQVDVAHVPARGLLAARPVGRDHEVAPRIVGDIAVAPQIVGIAALRAGRRVAVVTVQLFETAGPHQRFQGRAALDAEPFQRLEVGQHMGLAGQRHADPGSRQEFAQGLLAQGQRHAVPGGAVARHVAAGIEAHAARAADAGLHIGAREAHAARRQRIDRRRLEVRMAGAGQMVRAQLVAHDEQNVLNLAHGFLSRRVLRARSN